MQTEKSSRLALRQIKSDKSHIVLTTDEIVALVLMDGKDYINKAKTLLEQPNICKLICTGPINKEKAELIYLFEKDQG